MTAVSFGRLSEAFQGFTPRVLRLIETHSARAVCELGAGRSPAFSGFPGAGADGRLYVLDASSDELDLARGDFEKVTADLATTGLRIPHRFDLVFSRSVAEHVSDPHTFHTNVFSMLRTGGIAIHLFPTLFALPFVVNKLLPQRLTSWLQGTLAPRESPKFRAYYRWTRGPTPTAISRLRRIGFDVLRYDGFFGHDYYARIPVLRSVERMKTDYLLRHPHPSLTAFAIVTLRRPIA